jgi:hypothetical protein
MKKHPILLPVQKITGRLTVYKDIHINGTMAHPIASESNKGFLKNWYMHHAIHSHHFLL